MTRDNARELCVQIIFGVAHAQLNAADFTEEFFEQEHYASLLEENELFQDTPTKGQMKYIKSVVNGVFDNLSEIDEKIRSYARGWALSRISGTALAVLRVAVFEIMYMDEIPAAVSINSAVEIDKGYDEAEVVSFVNGVLGSIVRSEMVSSAEPELAEENVAAAEKMENEE